MTGPYQLSHVRSPTSSGRPSALEGSSGRGSGRTAHRPAVPATIADSGEAIQLARKPGTVVPCELLSPKNPSERVHMRLPVNSLRARRARSSSKGGEPVDLARQHPTRPDPGPPFGDWAIHALRGCHMVKAPLTFTC